MDACISDRKSLLRLRRVTIHVTTEQIEPLGTAHMSICIMIPSIAAGFLLVYAYCPEPRLHLERGTRLGRQFVVSDDSHLRKPAVKIPDIRL